MAQNGKVSSSDLEGLMNQDIDSQDSQGRTAATSDPAILGMDDGGTTESLLRGQAAGIDSFDPILNDLVNQTYHASGIFQRHEIDLFSKRYRFGVNRNHEALTNVKEYLFFTKTDLNIYQRDDFTGIPSTDLHPNLRNLPLWTTLEANQYDVLRMLQSSIDFAGATKAYDPFNQLLANCVQSNMDVPDLSADMIETPNNMYGVGYTYRGSSESGDDNFDFSLEFRDTRYTPVYNFFRAYEDYQILKHHGKIKPYMEYTTRKILYDQFAIYKILVDEDGERIVYCGKAYGVKPKGLPRSVWNNVVWDNGLSFSIDFNAAFYDDRPSVMYEFNNLARNYFCSMPYRIDIHNELIDKPDNRPAKAAYIAGLPGDTTLETIGGYPLNFCESIYAPGGRIMKLIWRGDDQI